MAPDGTSATFFTPSPTLVTRNAGSTNPAQPDTAGMADRVLMQALGFCAQKMGLQDAAAAIAYLHHGNDAHAARGVACQYCLYGIARQVAQSIGALDDSVKAVYTVDYDATPEDLAFAPEGQDAPVLHLLVWTQRKTAAFDALVAALDRALVQACGNRLGWRRLAHLLDVQVIDDGDIERRTGYAALFSSLHHRPIQVWSR